MKTQRSRNTFDAAKRYSSVYQQQGRMLTDADWNELSDVVKERLNDVLRDVIGGGTPRHRGMVAVETAADGTKTYELRWGYAYVDGIPGQSGPRPGAILDDPTGKKFEYLHQADFPDAPAFPATDYCLYVDVWERPVIFLEDAALRDPGLHGADTCTRTQTMAQVKWCSTTVDPEDPEQNYPIGLAPLTLKLRQGSTEPDPCDPCAEEIALNDRVGNYLFRVEVHAVDYDSSGHPARVTLKWSSENGAEQFQVGAEPVGFIKEGWVYEFFSGADTDFVSEKHLGYHLATTVGWLPTRGELHDAYPDAPPADFPLVRRWDGAGVFEKSGSAWTLLGAEPGTDRGITLSTGSSVDAPGHVVEGSSIEINLDAIDFTLDLADHPVLAGDYWEVAVRESVHRSGDTLMDEQLPRGILHHYLKLGTITGTLFTPASDEVCQRFDFPPLTDIRADDVCYDNEACHMPGVDSVQDALDHLCRQKDLRWHNKHLHGWGVVCGLQVYCAPRLANGDGDTTTDPEERRREIRVRTGYALDCEGNDIVLDRVLAMDLVSLIEALDAGSASPILTDGAGTACLSIALNAATGQPEIKIEKYDAAKGGISSLFENTLLWDFYQDCIVDLIDALKASVDFTGVGNEPATEPLVSVRRRLLITLIHLFAQFIFTTHGRYIFLSKKCHQLLKDFYEELRRLLQSKTFCAMFEGNEFPTYPFPDAKMSTVFGKNGHTRIAVHPSGTMIYTYGGANRLINVYDVASEELVQVHEMPSGEGAEIQALAFSSDGARVFAAASLRSEDTILGMADISGAGLDWRGTVVLCDIDITELIQSTDDVGLLVALGKGSGVYALRPATLFDLEKPDLQPVYAFNAVGHLVIDEQRRFAYATATPPGAASDQYNQFVTMSLQNIVAATPATPPIGPEGTTTLALSSGEQLVGEDGLALGNGNSDSRTLHIVANPRSGSTQKNLLSYTIVGTDIGGLAVMEIENTGVFPLYHADSGRLLLALEGSFRVMAVSADGTQVVTERIPVQIQPQALAIHTESERVYALNFASNTLTVLPFDELDITNDFLDSLATYRQQVILAFVALLGGLLQYLKDCFCQHLLVNCPECGEDDKVYLAVAEIRESKVFNICNFAKRKDVHTFPKVEYWLSLFPIIPLLKKGVEKLCCMVLPDFFDKLVPKVETRIQTERLEATEMNVSTYPSKEIKSGYVTYQRADVKGEFQDLKKRSDIYGRLGVDSVVNRMTEATPAKGGILKAALVNADVTAAKGQLEQNGVQVVSVNAYDPKSAGNLAAFSQTPSRIPRGSKVELYQKDGKVLFYSVVKEETPVVVPTEEAKIEIADLERRKAALENLQTVRSELAQIESKRAEVENIAALKEELVSLTQSKAQVGQELSALKEELAAVKVERDSLGETRELRDRLDAMALDFAKLQAGRAEEEEKLRALEAQRAATSTDLTRLRIDLTEIAALRDSLSRDVARIRPVKEIAGVTPELDAHFTELGIRTVEELASAQPKALTRTNVLTLPQASKLVRAAQSNLKKA